MTDVDASARGSWNRLSRWSMGEEQAGEEIGEAEW